MPQDFQRAAQQADPAIQSYNFGGLNTTANRLNVPYSDATELVNVNVNIAGALVKRRGTDRLSGLRANSTTLRSALGYAFVVSKVLSSVVIGLRVGSNFVTTRTLPNVFKDSVKDTRPSWVQLPDTFPRLLVLHPDNAPTEVYTVEQRQTYAAVPTTTYIINNCKRYSGIVGAVTAAYNDTVIVTNGTTQTRYVEGSGVTASYNSVTENMTITLPTVPGGSAVGTRVDVVGFRWAWWAESIEWRGDRFYDAVSRFNVTATDNNIAIPAGLRSDNGFGADNFYLSAYRTSSRGSSYPLSVQPSTTEQWTTSDGAAYSPGTDKYTNFSPFFITFGLARTPFPQPAEFLGLSRSRELRFNGNTNIIASDLVVTVNGVVAPQWFTGGFAPGPNGYFMLTPAGFAITAASQVASLVEFSASLPLGLPPSAVVVMTNTQRNHTGTAATTVDVDLNFFPQGGYRPISGLGLFCDYKAGVFPSCGAIYQGRLALSGVATDKSRIVLSSVNPEYNRYQYFQITDDLAGVPSDPFDVIASGGDADDYMVGLVEWNSSLFALTRRSVYRVHGGDQPLTAARRYVTYVSNIGLINPQSLVRTDTAVYYLSDGGVFNLTPKVEDGEYTALEKTLKIRDSFLELDQAKLVANSSMFFDSKYRRLYVAVPRASDTTGASSLFVMDATREAWSVYDTPNGFNVTGFAVCVDVLTGASNVGASTLSGLVMFDSEFYMDFCVSNTSASVSVVMGAAVPTVSGGNKYLTPATVMTTPYDDVRSVRLFLGSTVSTTPTEITAFTTQDEYIYLDVPTAAGQLLWFVARSPVNVSNEGLVRYGAGNLFPVSTISNNETLTPVTSLTFNPTILQAVLTINRPLSWDGVNNVTYGTHYYAAYSSPLFTQQALGSLKRTKHAYLYFNNGDDALYTNSYTVNEAFRTRVNANVAILYDSNDSNAVQSLDIYGFQDIVWDNALFDTPEASTRQQEYSLFKEALIGIGYAYRLSVWSYDEARWNLVGYQIDAKQKGLRYIARG